MSTVLRFAAFSAFALQSVYGLGGPSCDGSAADRLIQEIESFNTKLDSYASLAGNSAVSATHLSFQKEGRLLAERAVKTTEVKVPLPKQSVKPLYEHGQPQHEQEQHATVNSKKEEAKPPTHVAPKVVTTQVQVHTVLSKPQQQIHFSTYIPVEEQRHEALLQQSFESLTKQQSVLDSMGSACIPASHKPKVINALSKTFSLYLVHHKALASVNNLVKRAQHPQAGWLTMGNDVNSGYNGDEAELTASASSSTPTTEGYGYGYGYPGFAGYPPPQYSPQYITITVSPSTVNPPASTDSSDSGDDDGDDGGNDDDSASSSSAPAPAPAPLPTSPHHGIIYDSTIGLLLGSLHLVERILGIGGNKQIVSGPTSALSELMEKVANEYKVKL